jgi:alcohol dehydrogenase
MTTTTDAAMKALVYHGPGRHSWEDAERPRLITPTDAIVRVDAVTICGTDLHILKGDVPETTPGRILGHEAVGTVEDIGPGVQTINRGDKVLISCISACGRCRYCRAAAYGQCTGGGGWVLGHLIDGTQAEFVRTPFADTSLYRLPKTVADEAALMLADIVPTSYEVGVLNGEVRPGDTVAVIGAGPIGLAAIKTARLFSPGRIIAIDRAKTRLDAALEFGATDVISASEDVVARLRSLTDDQFADVAIEAVGVPETFELCTELVRAGGHVANIGVHGKPATLHLETLWIKNVTITTGLVDTHSTPALLAMLERGQLSTSEFITHRFGLGEMLEAYDVFADAEDTGALKVALFRT